MQVDEQDDDDQRDPEDPDESDMDDPDSPVVECLYCRKMIHEDSEWCHYCGKFQSAEDASRQVPLWIMVGTLLGIVGILGWVLIWLVERVVNH